MIEFFQEIGLLINGTTQVLCETCERIDSITFQDNFFTQYLGYTHYVLGTPLFTLLTSVILIGIGISIWTYLLKGIDYIRNLIPFN